MVAIFAELVRGRPNLLGVHGGTVNVFFDFAAGLAYESAPIWPPTARPVSRQEAALMSATGEGDRPALSELRDLARFYFGFSVAVAPIAGPGAVIAHVAETSDIGLVAIDQPASAGAWWRGLTAAAAPRITGVLPFIRAAGRPANLPAFIISPRLADPTPTEVQIYAAEARAAKRVQDGEVLARAGD